MSKRKMITGSKASATADVQVPTEKVREIAYRFKQVDGDLTIDWESGEEQERSFIEEDEIVENTLRRSREPKGR